jgi:hypothetical protein
MVGLRERYSVIPIILGPLLPYSGWQLKLDYQETVVPSSGQPAVTSWADGPFN